VTRQKKVMFDNKAKVQALVQRVRAFKREDVGFEEAEDESQREQQAAGMCREYLPICSGAMYWQCYRQSKGHVIRSRDG
jgi:hypothetical protein